jgi:hypothetical protein
MDGSGSDRGLRPLYVVVLGALAALVTLFLLLTQHYG